MAVLAAARLQDGVRSRASEELRACGQLLSLTTWKLSQQGDA